MFPRRALASVIERIHRSADATIAGGHWPRVSIAPCGAFLRVAYFGDPNSDQCDQLFEALARSDVAPLLASIELTADDVGANGVGDWALDSLVRPGVAYPALRAFRMERGEAFRHNRLVASGRGFPDGESGAIGRLCDVAPRLACLVSPSAPSASFFDRDRADLSLLHVDAGFDNAGFIRNLADCGEHLPALEVLGWGDYAETYEKDWKAKTTSRADYEAFFASKTFARLRAFQWRRPPFDDAEIDALLPTLTTRQSVSIERWDQRYVRSAPGRPSSPRAGR